MAKNEWLEQRIEEELNKTNIDSQDRARIKKILREAVGSLSDLIRPGLQEFPLPPLSKAIASVGGEGLEDYFSLYTLLYRGIDKNSGIFKKGRLPTKVEPVSEKLDELLALLPNGHLPALAELSRKFHSTYHLQERVDQQFKFLHAYLSANASLNGDASQKDKLDIQYKAAGSLLSSGAASKTVLGFLKWWPKIAKPLNVQDLRHWNDAFHHYLNPKPGRLPANDVVLSNFIEDAGERHRNPHPMYLAALKEISQGHNLEGIPQVYFDIADEFQDRLKSRSERSERAGYIDDFAQISEKLSSLSPEIKGHLSSIQKLSKDRPSTSFTSYAIIVDSNYTPDESLALFSFISHAAEKLNGDQRFIGLLDDLRNAAIERGGRDLKNILSFAGSLIPGNLPLMSQFLEDTLTFGPDIPLSAPASLADIAITLYKENEYAPEGQRKDQKQLRDSFSMIEQRFHTIKDPDIKVLLSTAYRDMIDAHPYESRMADNSPPLDSALLIDAFSKAIEVSPDNYYFQHTVAQLITSGSKKMRRFLSPFISKLEGIMQAISLGREEFCKYMSMLVEIIGAKASASEQNFDNEIRHYLRETSAIPKARNRIRDANVRFFERLYKTNFDFFTNEKGDVPPNVKFTLEELFKVGERVPYKRRLTYLDVEGAILDSVNAWLEDRIKSAEKSRLHDIFLRMYCSCEEDGLPQMIGRLPKFREALGTMPEAFQKDALQQAEKLLGLNYEVGMANPVFLRGDKSSKDQVALAASFLEHSGKAYASLGKDVGLWLEQGIQQAHSPQELMGFLNDEHSYFIGKFKERATGLRLVDVSQRIKVYTQMLSGQSFEIRSTPSHLPTRFEQGIIYLPEAVYFSKDFEENLLEFKARASYPCGALLYGTFHFTDDGKDLLRQRGLDDAGNVESIFASYGNRQFADTLFYILEVNRIDGQLRREFPRIRPILDAYKRNTLENGRFDQVSGYEAEEVLARLYQHFLGEDTMPQVPQKGKKAFGQAVSLMDSLCDSKAVSIVPTLKALDTIYTIFEQSIDLELPSTFQHQSAMEISPQEIDRMTLEKKLSQGEISKEEAVEGTDIFWYPEWDSKKNAYIERFARVQVQKPPIDGGLAVAQSILEKDSSIIRHLRKMFELLKPKYRQIRSGLSSGEVDLPRATQALIDMQAGLVPDDKVYFRIFYNRRDLATLVLSEVSGSTKRFADLTVLPPAKVIDAIRKTMLYCAEAFDAANDSFALAAGSGKSEKNVQFYVIKDFSDGYDDAIRGRIGGLIPMQENRDGALIRHATYFIGQQPQRTKLLIYLMEGYPEDEGYADERAFEDTKQALLEAKNTPGVFPIVFAFGRSIDQRIRSLREEMMYNEVRNPNEVPDVLLREYIRLTK
ncbi:hypothetical protein HYU13_00850 [Candidatus Woesearchaeota archaeon]|nr:hypothetical protein [Candidatus Woesearchaeota archaeon]